MNLQAHIKCPLFHSFLQASGMDWIQNIPPLVYLKYILIKPGGIVGVVIFHFPRKILRAWLEEKLRTREHNEEGSTSVPRCRLFRINFPPNGTRNLQKSQYVLLFSLYYPYVCLRPILPTWVRLKTPNYWNVVKHLWLLHLNGWLCNFLKFHKLINEKDK